MTTPLEPGRPAAAARETSATERRRGEREVPQDVRHGFLEGRRGRRVR